MRLHQDSSLYQQLKLHQPRSQKPQQPSFSPKSLKTHFVDTWCQTSEFQVLIIPTIAKESRLVLPLSIEWNRKSVNDR